MECCSLKQFPPYISCPLVRPRPPPPPRLSIVSSSGGISSNSLRLSSRTPIFTETDLFSRHRSLVSVSAARNCPQSSPISSKGFLPNGSFYSRLESGWLSFMQLIVDFLLFSPYTISRWCCNGLLHSIYFLIYLPAVSMLLIFGGCAFAAGTGLNFTIKGFCAAIIANFIFTFRDVLLEGGMKATILNGKSKDIWVDYYACLLILSLSSQWRKWLLSKSMA